MAAEIPATGRGGDCHDEYGHASDDAAHSNPPARASILSGARGLAQLQTTNDRSRSIFRRARGCQDVQLGRTAKAARPALEAASSGAGGATVRRQASASAPRARHLDEERLAVALRSGGPRRRSAVTGGRAVG